MPKSELITPPFLKTGDTIGLVAPARKIAQPELQPAIDLLKSWGLNIRFGKNLYNACNQFSGTDQERASDFQDMLDDPEVKAILCVRGGYGTLRIIDQLDFKAFSKTPKWVVGYSDVTVLHSAIHKLGVETLHATMPAKFSDSRVSAESLRTALFGEPLRYTWAAHPLDRKGEISGVLTGGNLSLLCALSGSNTDIDTRGKVLFLEDLDEYLYHIDRMMLNLKRSGKLENLAGLLVGGMTDMKDNTIPFGKSAEEIILDAVKEYDYPVAFNLPAGHTDVNMALVLGRTVRLCAAGENSLVF